MSYREPRQSSSRLSPSTRVLRRPVSRYRDKSIATPSPAAVTHSEGVCDRPTGAPPARLVCSFPGMMREVRRKQSGAWMEPIKVVNREREMRLVEGFVEGGEQGRVREGRGEWLRGGHRRAAGGRGMKRVVVEDEGRSSRG